MTNVSNIVSRALVTILMILLICPLLAQRQQVDSLLIVIDKVENETERTELLLDIAKYYNQLRSDSAYIMTHEALKKAKGLSDDNLISRSYQTLGIYFGRRQDSMDSAVYYLEALLELTDKTGNTSLRSAALSILGNCYARSDQKKALEYYARALDLKLIEEDYEGTADLYNNIANVYYLYGDYNSALDSYLRALNMIDDYDDLSFEGLLLDNIGQLYGELDQHDRSLAYHKKAEKIYLELDNPSKRASSFESISTRLLALGSYDQALQYARDGVKIAERLNMKGLLPYFYHNIAEAYSAKDMDQKAEVYYVLCINLSKEIKDVYVEIGGLTSFAEHKQKVGQNNEAIRYLLRAIDVSRESENPSQLENIHKLLFEIYQQQGKHKEALENHILYTEMKDSLESKEMLLEIGRIESRYELERVNAENELLQKEQALNEAEITLQKTQKYWLIGMLFLALIASLVIIWVYLQIKKRNQALRAKNNTIKEQNEELVMLNEEINMQQEELLATNEELAGNINRYEDAVADKDWTIELIGQYVAGPYRKIRNNLSQLKKFRNSNDQKHLLGEIEVEISSSESILTDLYDENSLVKDTFLLKTETTKLLPIAEEVCLHHNEVNDKTILYDFNFEVKEVLTDPVLIERIFRHIIEYLSLHVENRISIGSQEIDGAVQLSFRGFSKNLEEGPVIQDFFEKLKDSKMWGVKENKEVQLGMSLVQAICQALDYQMDVRPFSEGLQISIGVSADEELTYLRSEDSAPFISEDEVDRIFNKVETAFKDDKVYLNGDLSLNSLAKELEINAKYISYSINKRHQDNFQNYVNSYRIEEAKQLLTDPVNEHLSYMSIGFDAGFNSKSAFYSTFKKVTGQSPKDYKAEVQLASN